MRAVKLSVLNHLHFLEIERQKDLDRTRQCHASPAPLPQLSFPKHIHQLVQATATGTPTAASRRVSSKASNLCRTAMGMEKSLQAQPLTTLVQGEGASQGD